MSKKIAITLGEPAGIGIELVLQVAMHDSLSDCMLIGDEQLIQNHIDRNNLPFIINQSHTNLTTLNCHHIATADKVTMGQLNVNNAQYVLELLNHAAIGCIEKKYSAMLTCPLHKGIINDAGVSNFTGHTEYLAQLSNTDKVVMMLLNKYMRVALATTHLPLKDVSAHITQESLTEILTILIADMQTKFGIHQPKIAVCGLNPHAGEAGHLGMEEIDVINPVISKFQNENHEIFGCIPADTLFTTKKLKNYDAVLAMYHDQGLTPLKYAGFGQSVNITLGLPFIRTSVDHGTALDIAGKNQADAQSFAHALALTRELITNG